MEKENSEGFLEKKDFLENINPIEESEGKLFFTKEEIEDFVETPLIEACKVFYEKNIRTLSSSANEKDLETGEIYIVIDKETLSEENKEIADNVGESVVIRGKEVVKISIPISEESTEDDIRRKAVDIAEQFKKQKAEWIPKYSAEDIKKIYSLNEEDVKEEKRELLAEELGLYYNREEEIFYESREHCEKIKESEDL